MAVERTRPYDFDRVFRLLVSAAVVAGVIWLLAYLSDVLVPFAIAVLLAYLLNPIVNACQSRIGRRGPAVALTLAMLAVVALVVLPLAGLLIFGEISKAAEVLTDSALREKLAALVPAWLGEWTSSEIYEEIREQFAARQVEIQGALTEALPQLWQYLQRAASGVAGGVSSVLVLISAAVIVVLYLVFLMIDFNQFQARWRDHLPPQYRGAITQFVEEFSQAMGRYFRGQFWVAAICGILFAAGFKIIGLRMGILLGLFVGLLGMVPYLQALGLVPAIFLALVQAVETGRSPIGPLAGVVAVFVVVQLIQDGLLVPRFMGRSTGLRPWMIMLSIFVWGKLLGFLGLVLAIPLSCLGLAYYRRFVLREPPAAGPAP